VGDLRWKGFLYSSLCIYRFLPFTEQTEINKAKPTENYYVLTLHWNG